MSIDHNASPMLRFIEDYPAGDLFGFVFVRVLGLSFRFFSALAWIFPFVCCSFALIGFVSSVLLGKRLARKSVAKINNFVASWT